MPFVSRGGKKLDHALRIFQIDVTNKICADLGSNTGGFVDCLLQHGAMKIYAIDTGYGVLDWKLRKDPRVIVMERTNAMHVELPESPSVITIDVAWTKQRYILPAARRLLTANVELNRDGRYLFSNSVVTLIKPHYEAPPKLLRAGILPAEHLMMVIDNVKRDIVDAGFAIVAITESPIRGAKGNAEILAQLRLEAH